MYRYCLPLKVVCMCFVYYLKMKIIFYLFRRYYLLRCGVIWPHRLSEHKSSEMMHAKVSEWGYLDCFLTESFPNYDHYLYWGRVSINRYFLFKSKYNKILFLSNAQPIMGRRNILTPLLQCCHVDVKYGGKGWQGKNVNEWGLSPTLL